MVSPEVLYMSKGEINFLQHSPKLRSDWQNLSWPFFSYPFKPIFIKIAFIIPTSWVSKSGKLSSDLRSIFGGVVCMLGILVRVALYKCVYLKAGVPSGCLSLIAPHFLFLSQVVSLNLKLISSSRSPHQWASTFCLSRPSLLHSRHELPYQLFMWEQGIWTQVLMLASQMIYWRSHLLRPTTRSQIDSFFC